MLCDEGIILHVFQRLGLLGHRPSDGGERATYTHFAVSVKPAVGSDRGGSPFAFNGSPREVEFAPTGPNRSPMPFSPIPLVLAALKAGQMSRAGR